MFFFHFYKYLANTLFFRSRIKTEIIKTFSSKTLPHIVLTAGIEPAFTRSPSPVYEPQIAGKHKSPASNLILLPPEHGGGRLCMEIRYFALFNDILVESKRKVPM